jgi:hypothetical protein
MRRSHAVTGHRFEVLGVGAPERNETGCTGWVLSADLAKGLLYPRGE